MAEPAGAPRAHPERRTGPAWVRGSRAAIVVLTRIPVGGFPYADADWRWSAAYMPAVGAAVGAIGGGVLRLTMGAGPFVASTLAVLVSLLLTGALHEDGLADTADALGGGGTVPRDRVLAILKDSRIGAYGSAALTLALVLRVALLDRLGAAAPLALVASGALSRLTCVWLIGALPYVTAPDVAKGRAVMTASWPQLIVATASAVAGSVALVACGGESIRVVAIAWACVVGAASACGAYFGRRVGGITGDLLGAAQQVTECAVLLALCLA